MPKPKQETNFRRIGRGTFLATNDPNELPAPRLPAGADVGWAVSELFEAAWIASGRDPEALRHSPRSRHVSRAR